MGRIKRLRYTMAVLLGAVLVLGVGSAHAFAETSSSAHYSVTETQFTSGTSSQQGCSNQYCATVSIGSLDSANGSSGNYTTSFGTEPPDEPTLEVIVDPGDSTLGTLTTEQTGSKTMIVRIKSYESNGYTLQITGSAPTYDGHTLAPLTSPTASTPGTEQFGINAVSNTSPSVGDDPAQIPSSDTSFGIVNGNYSQANKFMYVDGATIAHSDKASGRTDYTISMIVNIANSTPAGHYTSDFSAVVVPQY